MNKLIITLCFNLIVNNMLMTYNQNLRNGNGKEYKLFFYKFKFIFGGIILKKKKIEEFP